MTLQETRLILGDTGFWPAALDDRRENEDANAHKYDSDEMSQSDGEASQASEGCKRRAAARMWQRLVRWIHGG